MITPHASGHHAQTEVPMRLSRLFLGFALLVGCNGAIQLGERATPEDGGAGSSNGNSPGSESNTEPRRRLHG